MITRGIVLTGAAVGGRFLIAVWKGSLLPMREATILFYLQQAMQHEGIRPSGAEAMYRLFQEAMETATGAGRFEGGLLDLVSSTEEEETIGRNIGPVLTSSAIAYAGAEIADAVRTGLGQVAAAIESHNDD